MRWRLDVVSTLWRLIRAPVRHGIPTIGSGRRARLEIAGPELLKARERAMVTMTVRALKARKPLPRVAFNETRAAPLFYLHAMIDRSRFSIIPIDTARWLGAQDRRRHPPHEPQLDPAGLQGRRHRGRRDKSGCRWRLISCADTRRNPVGGSMLASLNRETPGSA
jgi:hypothetical protein